MHNPIFAVVFEVSCGTCGRESWDRELRKQCQLRFLCLNIKITVCAVKSFNDSNTTLNHA